MKELFINNSFNFINKHHKLDHYNTVKIKYGLEVMYHFITKLIVVLLLSLYFNLLKQTLFIYIFYGFLRINAHGLHAKSNLSCWIITLTTYILLSFLSKHLIINFNIGLLIIYICIFSYFLWAPSDTKGKPIVSKKLRFRLKLLTVITASIEVIIYFKFYKYVGNSIIYSNILQSMLINPVIYKISNQKRNNYLALSNC